MIETATDELCGLLSSELVGLSGLELRVACNKVRRAIDALDPIVRPEPVLCAIEPMTVQEADQFGRCLMGFGKYAESQRRDVPREYLDWLVETKREEWQQLLRYMKTLKDDD